MQVKDELWTGVDAYICDVLVRPDPVFDDILARSDAAGLPSINVSPAQGKMLQLFVRALAARRVLEVGTLGGYSTTWLAKGLPEGGRVTTIELEPRHADVARGNFELAGVSDRVEIRLGRATEVLERMAGESLGPFDLVFIDADKGGYADYLRLTLELSRPGTVIFADNVVRGGRVADPGTDEESARGIRRFHEAVAREPRVSATAIQTVGAKGYDGFTLMVVG